MLVRRGFFVAYSAGWSARYSTLDSSVLLRPQLQRLGSCTEATARVLTSSTYTIGTMATEVGWQQLGCGRIVGGLVRASDVRSQAGSIVMQRLHFSFVLSSLHPQLTHLRRHPSSYLPGCVWFGRWGKR